MRSFIRKQIAWGAAFLLCASIFIGYTAYKLNSTQTALLGVPQCYYQLLDQTNVLDGLLNAYEYDVNGMIAAPTSYTTFSVENSPLRKRIEENLDLLTVNARSCADSYNAVGSDLELLKKSLRDISVATSGLIEAFSSGDPKNQSLVNVGNFTGIIQSAQVSASEYTRKIKSALTSKTPMGAKKHLFVETRLALWMLMLVCIVFCFILLSKSYRVSRSIMRIKDAALKIKHSSFKSQDIISLMGNPHDAELFDLYDAVSSVALMMELDIQEQKQRIYDLDDELSRHKVISTYTTAIINSLNDGIMVTDDLLKVSFVNASFEKFWRVKRSSLVDQDAKELPFIRLVKGWKDGLSKALYSGLAGSKPVTFEAEYRLSEKNSTRKVKFYILPLKDSKGKEIIGTVTITRPTKE